MKRTLTLTSPRMHGADVAYARRLLGLKAEPDVWDDTAAASARRTKWELGYPDDQIQGTFGTRLERFLVAGAAHRDPPALWRVRAKRRAAQVDVGSRAVDEALKWVGTKEHPAGTNICVPFTTWYGWKGWGAPWCAVFVSYCLQKAGFTYVDPSAQRWAYCPKFLDDARHGRYGLKAVTPHEAKKGTVLLFDWDHDGVADHIGFATGPVDFKRSVVPTVEGNTSSSVAGDQSNGGEVCQKWRGLGEIIGFVHAGPSAAV